MIVLYAAWCAACWVLRGGKYGDIHRYLFGREPGTTVTRIVCAFPMAAPLAVLFDPALIVLWPSIFLAMTVGYYGGAMGLVRPWRDHALMAAWGVTVAAIAIAPLAYFVGPGSLAYSAIGALAVAAYAANKPFGRRWNTDWTERAEFCTGAIFGAAIYLAT